MWSRIFFALSLSSTMGAAVSHAALYRRYENGEDLFGNVPLDIAALVFPLLSITFHILKSRASQKEHAIRSNIRLHY